VAAVLLTVLVGGLLRDVAHFRERYIFVLPSATGDDSVALADRVGRARMLSYIVGMATREAAQGRGIDSLEVPEDLATLSGLKPDVFAGIPQPTLQAALINPLVEGRIEVVGYDAMLTEEQIAALLASGKVIDFPRGVQIVIPESRAGATQGAARLRLYSDESKTRIFIVESDSL
jgi:hypothetical protein